ncbi:unnamed protein product [Durusdinium trenchii]|uniref:Uncharacterized protein n=1 Tax=Durusdinium trenchii TaxID=1381693 RepID=A0ABP0LL40_9DINO
MRSCFTRYLDALLDCMMPEQSGIFAGPTLRRLIWPGETMPHQKKSELVPTCLELVPSCFFLLYWPLLNQKHEICGFRAFQDT